MARVVAVGVAAAALGGAAAPAFGAAWVPPANVGLGAEEATFVVAGSAGSAVVAYTIADPVTFDSSLAVSSRGPGQTPSNGAVVSTSAVEDPSAASNSTGRIAVAWTSLDPSDNAQLTVRIYDNGALVDEDVLNSGVVGTDAGEAEVAVAPDGSILVSWITGAAPTVARAAIRRPDGTYTAAFNLSNTGEASELETAADATGFITTFVRAVEDLGDDTNTTSIEVVRVPLAGGTPQPETLATGIADLADYGDLLGAPEIAAGGGRAIVAFEHLHTDEATETETFTVRGAVGEVDTGVGTSATLLSVGQTLAERPAVAAGPDGTLAVSYIEGSGGGTPHLAVVPPTGGLGPAQAIPGAAGTRADVAVLPDGSVLTGVVSSRLQGWLRSPSGAIAPVAGFADAGGVTDGALAGDGAGHVVAALRGTVLGGMSLGAYDAAAPRFGTVSAPSRGRVGQRLEFSSTGASDAWSALGTTSWAFGDGESANGTEVAHTYDRSGNYSPTVSLPDAAGNVASRGAGNVAVSAADGTPPPPPPPPTQTVPTTTQPQGQGDTTAPVLGSVKLNRSVFRVASGSTAFAAGGAQIRAGAEARFRTLEPGLVRVVIARMADVPSLRSRCAAAGLPLRSKGGSTRRVKFERILGAGTHRIRLTGRAGGKALPRGRYELRVSVADQSGNRSKAQVARFTLC